MIFAAADCSPTGAMPEETPQRLSNERGNAKKVAGVEGEGLTGTGNPACNPQPSQFDRTPLRLDLSACDERSKAVGCIMYSSLFFSFTSAKGFRRTYV
jgi:hypothetical protein